MSGCTKDKGMSVHVFAFILNALLTGGMISGATADERLSVALSVRYSDPLTQWVIAQAKTRRLPHQIHISPTSAPLQITQNLQMDASLLSGVADLTPQQVKALGLHASSGPRWAPCHAGPNREQHTFTLCYPDARTDLTPATRRGLAAIAAQAGLFTLHSEIEGLGARTHAVARQRAQRIEELLVRSGVSSEHLQSELFTRDRCKSACANRVVITQRPFK